jgi:hypothetical protein
MTLRSVIPSSGSGGGSVNSVTGLNTDNTDSANPIVKISVDGITITGLGTPASPLIATGSGGGAVDSVNGQTGVVVLDADDIDDTSTTHKFTTAADITKLAGIEAGADVTDATNVNAAGAVMNSDYTPAHSILVQQSGTGSPTALAIGNNTLVGRLSGGGSDIDDLSTTDVRTLLSISNVDNTSDLNKPISTATQTALNAKADNSFSTIAVSGQSNVVADSAADTLTLVAGSNITITTDATTDAITIAATSGGVSDGDKGDITVSGSGTTWTIDNSVVTLAKIANASASSKLLGSGASGSGAAYSEITLGTNLSMSGTTLNATGGGSGGVSLLAQSNAAISLTGTTTETTLATYTLPANTLGANGILRITSFWSCNNTANNHTARVRFGGTLGTVYLTDNLNSRLNGQGITHIRANNATNSQKAFAGNNFVGSSFTSGTVAVTTSSVDTTSNVDVVISGQLANSGDNMTLEGYTIELLKL